MSGGGGKTKLSAQDWDVLYRQYSVKLEHYFASEGLRPADTEDLTQEVFQKLARSKVPENPKAYLYTIARHILSQHWQHQSAERAAFEEYCRCVTMENEPSACRALDTGPSNETSGAEVERILRTIAATLSPKDAELVALRFLEKLSTKQVAQRMHCSENAVSKRLQRLRPLLRRLIGNDTMQP